uniref:(northern house mosquito) hypothetical protein n=1 Tax=Culex pipiens TaxID=7175 RepID=A0A8D8C946_CULPI
MPFACRRSTSVTEMTTVEIARTRKVARQISRRARRTCLPASRTNSACRSTLCAITTGTVWTGRMSKTARQRRVNQTSTPAVTDVASTRVGCVTERTIVATELTRPPVTRTTLRR